MNKTELCGSDTATCSADGKCIKGDVPKGGCNVDCENCADVFATLKCRVTAGKIKPSDSDGNCAWKQNQMCRVEG